MSDLELREKVARLMGWRQAHDGAWIMPPKITDDATTAGALWELPHYETNIADAWEVVEFMRERGWDVSVHTPANHDPYAMLCGPEKRHDGLGGPYVAPTAPLAICKAFVAAMENNHES